MTVSILSVWRDLSVHDAEWTHNESPEAKGKTINPSQEHLPPALSISSIIQVEPKDTTETIRNQLAKSALINDSRSLKTGIASKMIRAMTHNMSTIIAEIPKLPQLFLLIRSVPLNIRTYICFAATRPLMAPAMTIVGMATP